MTVIYCICRGLMALLINTNDSAITSPCADVLCSVLCSAGIKKTNNKMPLAQHFAVDAAALPGILDSLMETLPFMSFVSTLKCPPDGVIFASGDPLFYI